jgi:transposase
MESMERSKPRPRRSFTPEFKAEIVELGGRGDRSIRQVARDLDLTETAVREWVRQADRDAGSRRDGRADQRRAAGVVGVAPGEPAVREDLEILKRATRFFAKETR